MSCIHVETTLNVRQCVVLRLYIVKELVFFLFGIRFPCCFQMRKCALIGSGMPVMWYCRIESGGVPFNHQPPPPHTVPSNQTCDQRVVVGQCFQTKQCHVTRAWPSFLGVVLGHSLGTAMSSTVA